MFKIHVRPPTHMDLTMSDNPIMNCVFWKANTVHFDSFAEVTMCNKASFFLTQWETKPSVFDTAAWVGPWAAWGHQKEAVLVEYHDNIQSLAVVWCFGKKSVERKLECRLVILISCIHPFLRNQIGTFHWLDCGLHRIFGHLKWDL